jgi:hypothetical protein
MTDQRPRRGDGSLPADAPHVAADLAEGQGVSDDPLALPAEDVAQLSGIRPSEWQQAVADDDEVDRLGEITDTAIYEGNLEARPPDSDQPDEDEAQNLELLYETELRDGETDDPSEAAEEGLTWVPPADPPVRPGELGQPEIAAGFGTTADDEPYDANHHSTLLPLDDERTERVLEALRAHAATAGLADRIEVETVGSRVIVAGVVDDLADEDEIVAVASEVDGVTSVESRIEVAGLQ